MRTTFAVLISILVFFSCQDKNKNASLSANKPANIPLKIDSLLIKYEQNGAFMGSVILSQKGKTIYKNTVGYSDVETKKKASTNTRYRIGSVTKTFTATLVFKAIEEHKLGLNQTIESYFPNIKNADKISIAHLLQHRSGVQSYTKDKWFFENRTQYISSEDMLAKISTYQSDFDPNTQAEYSNSNYFLLALILEKIYNSSYDTLLQENICKPLGLNDTYVGKEINIQANESYSYSYDKKWLKFPETHLSSAKGTGSIVSTPKDLNRFFENLLTGKILSEKNLLLMKDIKDRFGMGLFRYKINDRQGFGHRGRIDEFRATSIYFAKENLTFTLVSNGSKMDINELYQEIIKVYLNDALVEISENDLKNFVGVYVSQSDPDDTVVFIQDKNVLVNFIKNEFKAPLVYKGNNRFVLEQMYAESISFTFSADGKQMVFEQSGGKWDYIKE
ncbi:D-Ala-D-Ala carboxypeptidase [Polaribacter pacificus]|uniref:D-Ala-D-Ala carboxypeptidase n=1 Tax=Polaribacter pacificus TaxID=1775173 RepID=A0A917HYR1_9FLAO|nr:serine hydrolase domain-containing protein [Polaribacter pacificus]GGG98744.1 D-Ala-D-Ala carboxypeptidase [Polaribacter pacificus]